MLRKYIMFLSIYIICNSFWILVIKASFSNRFAYLSWFLFPIVLVYPLVMFKIRNKNNHYLGLIMLLHLGFTLFMFFLY